MLDYLIRVLTEEPGADESHNALNHSRVKSGRNLPRVSGFQSCGEHII